MVRYSGAAPFSWGFVGHGTSVCWRIREEAWIIPLKGRPDVCHGHSQIKEYLTQNAISRPVLIGEAFDFFFARCVMLDDRFQRRPRNNKARAAVCEHDLPYKHGIARVYWLCRVKALQLSQQHGPENKGVCLHEDVPLLFRSHLQCSVDHREELPFIKLPSRVLRLPGHVWDLVRWTRKL